MTTRRIVVLAIGVIMVGLGVFLALRPLWSHGRPLTMSIWVDAGFALLFLARGAMNIRTALWGRAHR